MKKYKLLKDLPDLRAGVVFTETEHLGYCNCVQPSVYRPKPNVEPHYQFANDVVEKLKDWFEEIK